MARLARMGAGAAPTKNDRRTSSSRPSDRLQVRSVLSFSRDLEFATETELAKRMGCAQPYWLRAALKEFIDNSLDAIEEAGIATPSITVCIEGDVIAVADNGPGFPPELVERLCERGERTSTREAYAAPDRGSQGNAVQVLMALPFGFGGDEAGLTIVSQGVEHSISLRVNRLHGCIELERTTRGMTTAPGTIVGMRWPEVIDRRELEALINRHAWLNPHAQFRLIDDAGQATEWQATTAITKWTPGLPIPPHWYTLDRFTHRILLEIRRDPKITVSQFLASFKGLTSSTRRSELAAAADLSYKPLAALLDVPGTALDHWRAIALLTAMQKASRPPKPDVLGSVGKETFEAWARNHDCGEPQLLAYTTIDGVVQDDVPWRWEEVGFAHLAGASERQVLIGQNFSPAISTAEMFNMVLPYCPWHLGSREPIALFLHRITPHRQTLDYGKSRVAVGYSETTAVRDALNKIAKPWIKYREAQQKGKRPPAPDEPRRERITFKAASFQAIEAAYNKASSNGAMPVDPQQVWYAARPTILRLTDRKELKPEERSRFCYVLLPLFMREHPELTSSWRILYKPRGELIEPHTGRRVGLGTSEVAFYCRGWTNGLDLGETDYRMPDWGAATEGPHNRYGAVVIVEKAGPANVLRAVGLDRKHDVAIGGNEGQSVEAELVLADAFGHADVPIFVLADFDRQGFTIADNLRKGTWRHRYEHPVEVIHVGLRLDQIDAFGGLASKHPGGLEDEPIGENNLKHVGDDRLRECGASQEEIELLGSRRCELNALRTDQLVAMLEGALAEHGIGKVIPNPEHLRAAWRAAKAHAEIAEALEEANKRAARWQAERAPDDLAEQVRELLKRDPAMSWDTALRLMVEERQP